MPGNTVDQKQTEIKDESREFWGGIWDQLVKRNDAVEWMHEMQDGSRNILGQDNNKSNYRND